MNKYKMILTSVAAFYCPLCLAINETKYGYDSINSEIYAINGNIKKTLNFEINHIGNPSYSFGFFSNSPAIIADGRSLHDFTAYTTLKLSNFEFYIDCIYYNVKSKQTGMLIKEGLCGLNAPAPQNYTKYIEEAVTSIENKIDIPDTAPLLDGRIKYLAIVINHNTNDLVYKLYENKSDFLNDKFSILVASKNGDCKTYSDSPWVITTGKKASDKIQFKTEVIKNGELSLINASPQKVDLNKCILFPTFRISATKAFFHDSSFNPKKSYLVKDDKINLRSISDDGKWCLVDYINNKNKIVSGNILCSELIL